MSSLASVGLNSAFNYSWYAVPAAWLVGLAPHVYAMLLVNTQHAPGAKGFDFSNPQNTRRNIANTGLSAEAQDRFSRAEQANDNNFVGLPFFAAAVIAGNLARLPVKTLNTSIAIYLGSRVAYNLLYIFGTNNALGLARTVAWFAGSIVSVGLFCEAGKALQN